MTAVTWGSRATVANMLLMRARTRGFWTVPELTAKTIVSRSPAWAGKLRWSRSAARCASELGSVKLLEYVVPAERATALTPSSSTSHPSTTYLRCVVDQRASFSKAGSRRLGWTDALRVARGASRGGRFREG